MAYPDTIVTFSTKTDNKDVVWASHVNALQSETKLVEQTLGALILTKGTAVAWDSSRTSFSTVKERLDWSQDGLLYFDSRKDSYIKKSGGVGNIVQQSVDEYGLALFNGRPTPALQIWGITEPINAEAAPITLSGYDGKIKARYIEAREIVASTTPLFWGKGDLTGTGELLKLDVDGAEYFKVDRDGKVSSRGNVFGGTTVPKLGLVLSTDTGSTGAVIMSEANSTGTGNHVYLKKISGDSTWLTRITTGGRLEISVPTGTSYFDGDTGTAALQRIGGSPSLTMSTNTGTEDVKFRASGGLAGAPGQGNLNIDARTVKVGSDGASTVTLNGGVLMPNMQTTYFLCDDKAVYIKKRPNATFNSRPDSWYSFYVSDSDASGLFDTTFTFVAPASGSVLCLLAAELYANCSLTSVTYQIRTASGAIHTDFGYKHGIAHNAYKSTDASDVSYMTCTSPYHVNGLTPGATYTVEIRGNRWIGPTTGGFSGNTWTMVRDLRMYVQPLFSSVSIVR